MELCKSPLKMGILKTLIREPMSIMGLCEDLDKHFSTVAYACRTMYLTGYIEKSCSKKSRFKYIITPMGIEAYNANEKYAEADEIGTIIEQCDRNWNCVHYMACNRVAAMHNKTIITCSVCEYYIKLPTPDIGAVVAERKG